MQHLSSKSLMIGFSLVALALTTACGKDPAAGGGNVSLNASLAETPATASLRSVGDRLFQFMLGVTPAFAATASFNQLDICLAEITYEVLTGSVDPQTLKPGLISFVSGDTQSKSLGSIAVPSGTVLKNIKFVIQGVPSLCGSSNSVAFDPGSGSIDITQDVHFRFDFDSSGYTVQDSSSITAYLGQIINGMVGLGAGLDNSSIQTVNVGQAR